jgi:malate synthase
MDYIFSYIKNYEITPFIVQTDQVTMTSPLVLIQLVIQRCHKRCIHAIGGMAAQIPIKNDEANAIALSISTDEAAHEKETHKT